MRLEFREFHSSGALQVNALLLMDERPGKGADEFEIYYQKVRTEGMYQWRPILIGMKGMIQAGNEKL